MLVHLRIGRTLKFGEKITVKSVEEFRKGIGAEELETVDCLREIISGCRADLVESIKWNGPNFSVGEQDRITLGEVVPVSETGA